jgi:two-component system phosphate regulon sensor histidine kinase PhoR
LGEVFARVEKLRTKARNRKKKYHRLLREVRESTGALADGGIILNADNEIMWFNRAASNLLGLEATDLGHRLDNLLRYPDFVAYLKSPTGDGITVRRRVTRRVGCTCRSFRTAPTSGSRSSAT